MKNLSQCKSVCKWKVIGRRRLAINFQQASMALLGESDLLLGITDWKSEGRFHNLRGKDVTEFVRYYTPKPSCTNNGG